MRDIREREGEGNKDKKGEREKGNSEEREREWTFVCFEKSIKRNPTHAHINLKPPKTVIKKKKS